MKYEIINMSDECYITSENEDVAKFCCLFVGEGHYALKNAETKETVLPLFILSAEGELQDYLKRNFGEAKQFIKDNYQAILDCCDSFEYARERTSLNNIELQFKNFKLIIERNFGQKGE